MRKLFIRDLQPSEALDALYVEHVGKVRTRGRGASPIGRLKGIRQGLIDAGIEVVEVHEGEDGGIRYTKADGQPVTSKVQAEVVHDADVTTEEVSDAGSQSVSPGKDRSEELF